MCGVLRVEKDQDSKLNGASAEKEDVHVDTEVIPGKLGLDWGAGRYELMIG